jgi:hypothetical protein
VKRHDILWTGLKIVRIRIRREKHVNLSVLPSDLVNDISDDGRRAHHIDGIDRKNGTTDEAHNPKREAPLHSFLPGSSSLVTIPPIETTDHLRNLHSSATRLARTLHETGVFFPNTQEGELHVTPTKRKCSRETVDGRVDKS